MTGLCGREGSGESKDMQDLLKCRTDSAFRTGVFFLHLLLNFRKIKIEKGANP